MACYSQDRLQLYAEGELNSIEQGRIRDHLLGCDACRLTAERYGQLNRSLEQPVTCEPPETVVRQVMRRLYPELPRYSSIAALIAASFFFLVTWIYVYFDFAHNSLIRALQVTSADASGWFVSAVKLVSSLFSYTYASFKAIRAFLQVVANVDLGVEVIALFMLTLSLLLFYGLFHAFARRLRRSRP